MVSIRMTKKELIVLIPLNLPAYLTVNFEHIFNANPPWFFPLADPPLRFVSYPNQFAEESIEVYVDFVDVSARPSVIDIVKNITEGIISTRSPVYWNRFIACILGMVE